ncbi:transcription/translation regulatory transformer protein RfaH [Pseudomonas citronellolis]|uniref:transcription/translation regulatory transformer protein RfaH n=1 Tax=Pseudomonas citronellolis TaxID=53408 RepID=UPI002112E783|nr:transcription/translation regulatory transformer protein RfaH [Pseudomonas citronellolis]UUC48961.1 transcription/translation regulatory transformer protein RfaH [Pseudomonas citronellolis]
MPDATGKQWYLIQCKPRQDMRALENLERQGYRCLLPMHQIERLQKGKLQQISEPLFPGYLFIQLDRLEDNWLPIRSTRGVTQVVNFGGRPTSVPSTVIDKLLYAEPLAKPLLVAGDRVRLHDPNFQEIEAIFMERNGDERVLLLLKLLQREIVVKVPLSSVERILS